MKGTNPLNPKYKKCAEAMFASGLSLEYVEVALIKYSSTNPKYKENSKKSADAPFAHAGGLGELARSWSE